MKKILLLIFSLFIGVQISYAASYDSETECGSLFTKFFFNDSPFSDDGN